MSFFGGDLSKAHFAPAVRYRAHPDETSSEGTTRRRAELDAIKAAGFIDFGGRYFEFWVKDEAAKAKAKKACQKYADKVMEATGLTLVVREGCFL